MNNWFKKYAGFIAAALLTATPLGCVGLEKTQEMMTVNRQSDIAKSVIEKTWHLKVSEIYHFYGYTPILCHFYENGYPYIARDITGKEHRGTICVEKETDKARMVFDTTAFPNPIIASSNPDGSLSVQQVLPIQR